jgi:hypothetical protein
MHSPYKFWRKKAKGTTSYKIYMGISLSFQILVFFLCYGQTFDKKFSCIFNSYRIAMDDKLKSGVFEILHSKRGLN